jgi:hypothetical protein
VVAPEIEAFKEGSEDSPSQGGPFRAIASLKRGDGPFHPLDARLGFLNVPHRPAEIGFIPCHSCPSGQGHGPSAVAASVQSKGIITRRLALGLGARFADPTFAAPLFTNLIAQDEGGFALIWSRPQRRD